MRNFDESLEYLCDLDGQTMAQMFPTFRWVFPEAHHKKPTVPTESTMLSKWFDVYNVRDFAEREEMQAEGLRDSVIGVREVIAREYKLLGGRADRIILAGVSQGAAALLHTWFNLDLDALAVAYTTEGATCKQDPTTTPPLPPRLGAFWGFSCRLPFSGRSLTEMRNILALDNFLRHDNLLRSTPLLLEHCVNDQKVPVAAGRDLRDPLTSFGVDVTWKEYPRGGHWFNCPRGMNDLRDFVNSRILNGDK